MLPAELIRLKREGKAIPAEELADFIAGYAEGRIPDYQAAAWLMAVYFQGMKPFELEALTSAMMNSGEVFDLSGVPGPKVDKHSTGGVGDKVSLILAPLAAACGLVVPMVSGRGLGHTGGTLDKLESIPGFKTNLTRSAFIRQLKKIGVAMGAQTPKFVPADRKLYALRDVTATVESIPLIAASIMSKKLAEGCDALVLDVKTGNGAFMSKMKDAQLLARTMIGIGTRMGRQVSALITDMSQPLGRTVGNALEVREAIACLRGESRDGEGCGDLMKVTEALTSRMLVLGGVAGDEAEADAAIERALGSGRALEKFQAIIEAQGGDPKCTERTSLLPSAPKKTPIEAERAGWIGSFATREIGLAAVALGAGRARMSDSIDPAVGFRVNVKIGDRVAKGDPVIEIHYREKAKMEEARSRLKAAFTISEAPVKPPSLIRRKRV